MIAFNHKYDVEVNEDAERPPKDAEEVLTLRTDPGANPEKAAKRAAIAIMEALSPGHGEECGNNCIPRLVVFLTPIFSQPFRVVIKAVLLPDGAGAVFAFREQ